MYPILFEFSVITVFSLWVFIAIGFVVGSLILIRLAKNYRVRLSIISDNGLFLLISTLLISRLFFVISHTDYYFYHFTFKSFFSLFALWDKGLSFWGAIIGFFAGIIYISNQKRESVFKITDLIIPSIFIGMFFGNIGAFLDGINFGKPTGLPWGIVFRSANVRYISPIHPTQLYGVFYTLGLGILLLMLLKKIRNTSPGLITKLGCFCFSIFKFIEEFFRGDEKYKILGIRFPQIIAGLAIIFLVYLFYKQNAFERLKELLPIRKFQTPNSPEIEAKRNPQ